MWGIEIIVMLAMVAFNGLLAAYEIALASISEPRLNRLKEEGRRGASAALHMKQGMEGSLAVVQLGITLVGAIAAATGGAGAEEQISPVLQEAFGLSVAAADVLAIASVVIPLTVFTIIFGELIPKVFALRNKDRVCLNLSAGMRWFAFIAWPIVWFLETSVRILTTWAEKVLNLENNEDQHEETLQDLRTSAATARRSRLIGAQEERIILRTAELVRQPISKVMLPAEFISMLHINSSLSEALVAAHLDMHTRFPVSERQGDPQSIVGYVNFKDIVVQLRMNPKEKSLRSILRTITSFPQEMPSSECLQRLIRANCHIALIRDGKHRIVGMVTMEDMLEEVVGEIEDEFDRLPKYFVTTGQGWIAGGGVALESVTRQTGLDLSGEIPDEERRTIDTWICHHVEGPIHGGETLERPGVSIIVRKSRRHRVLEAYLQPSKPKEKSKAKLQTASGTR